MENQQEQTRLLREVRLALQRNDYPVAIKSLEKVVKLAQERGDVGAEGRHLGNLALTYYRLGQPDKALYYFQRALICARKDGDRFTEDGLLGNMGNILREVGRFKEAATYLNQALVIAAEIGDTRGRGIWLSNLGLVHDDLKESDKAIPLHKESVAVARMLNDRSSTASRLGNLGNSHIAVSEYDKALVYFEESVQLYEDLGKVDELALRLGILGNIYAHLGRQLHPAPEARDYFAQALTYYDRTMSIARELHDRLSEAELLRSIGNVLVSAGQIDDAAEYLSVAQQLFEALDQQQKAREVEQVLQKIADYR